MGDWSARDWAAFGGGLAGGVAALVLVVLASCYRRKLRAMRDRIFLGLPILSGGDADLP